MINSLIDKLIATLLAGTALLASAAHAATDVYLFGGQSNMEAGIVTGFVNELQSADPTATIVTSRYRNSGTGLDAGWDGQAWLGDPPGTGRTNFFGGTDSSDANKGNAYTAMLTTWGNTLSSISGDYTIKGIFWVQGEQDTKNTISANRYASSLDNLISRLHDDLALAQGSVQFYYSSMESTASQFTFAGTLRGQQDAADKNSGSVLSITNANWVDASGLVYTDGVHYDALSYTLLGERFASAVPEPGSLALLGLSGLCLLKRRRRDS